MKYPILSEIGTGREMTTYFAGYNNTHSCKEGEFFDMRNVTTQYYPILSPRNKRGIGKTFTKLQGILDKEKLIWIDNKALYIDNELKTLSGVSITDGSKDIYKMGAYVVIMPDKIWYNTDDGSCGYIDATKSIASGTSVSFTLCNGDGNAITWHDENYYKTHAPVSGDYMMTTTDTKSSLKVYSEATQIWSAVTTTYIKISASGIGRNFKKEDGIKITIDNSSAKWSYAKKIFVNEEPDGKLSINSVIFDKGDDYITIIAILDANKTFTNMPITVERKMPDVKFLTECQNRLWGCSKDGHEIYCCKLGDVTNWNYFSGISIDSYAATVGSDGEFTGAVTYNQNPIFFKEHSFLKVSVSQNGAHSYREQNDRGVQSGSYKSICNVNGVLFYKGVTNVYAFDGSSPIAIGDALGEHRYFDAVSGTIDGRYYMCVKEESGKHLIFVYDTKNNIWAVEDGADILFYLTHKDDLFFVSNSVLYSVSGTEVFGSTSKEADVSWYAESGNIGFALPDNKYISRVNIRMSLAIGAHADFWIKYDEDERWTHVFDMTGKGTKSFTIPVPTRRCDHFKYRLSGKGECKIYSITKTIEEGSDGA